MIIPIATKSSEHPDNFESRELMENCFPYFNDEGAEFPVTICMRRGTELAVAATGDFMGYFRQQTQGSSSLAYNGVYLFTDKIIHSAYAHIASPAPVAPVGTVTSNPYADRDAVYYGTTNGIRRHEWGVGETHAMLTGKTITQIAMLNGYLLAYVHEEERIYVSKYREFTNFDALDHIQICGNPVSHMVIYNDEVWAFREDEKITVYANDPSVVPPFSRVTAATLDIMPDALARPLVDQEFMYFVGSDHHVYIVSGYTPQKISGLAQASTLPVQGEVWVDITPTTEGARRFVCVPNAAGAWCYDVGLQAWHKRTGLPSSGGAIELMASSGNGLYKMQGDTDAGSAITRTIVSPPISSERKRLGLNALGFGANTDQAWTLSVSKDGGDSYSITRPLSMKAHSARNRLYRFGSGRSHVIKLESTTVGEEDKISGMEVY